VHDPTDPVGRLLFNVLAMVAEFEADLIRARTREGVKVAKAKGRLRAKEPKLSPSHPNSGASSPPGGTNANAKPTARRFRSSPATATDASASPRSAAASPDSMPPRRSGKTRPTP
jgi:resolvase-like protein